MEENKEHKRIIGNAWFDATYIYVAANAYQNDLNKVNSTTPKKIYGNYEDEFSFSQSDSYYYDGSTKIPTWQGSGPVSGTHGINELSKSNKSILNYKPKSGSIEFIYDTKTKTFIVGEVNVKGIEGSPHEQLAQSIGLDRYSDEIVGGMFKNDGTTITTSEFSGHYGVNWNDTVRQNFVEQMKEYGIDVSHQIF